MNKKSKGLLALATAGLIVCNLSTVLAAPSEIYGYKKLSIWDFHEDDYDKYGNIRITPDSTIFDTNGKLPFKSKVDGISSSSIYRTRPMLRSKKSGNLLETTKHKKNSKKVDAVSGATKHKDKDKGSKPDVISGASNFISADVVYDFDMLSNAVILKNLGVEDKNIDKIINNWNTTTRTAITKHGIGLGEGLGIDYDAYINKATEEYMNGRDLSFEDFAKNNKNKTRHLPYKAKYILEDGKYGRQTTVSEINALNAPNINANNENNILGQDLVLNFENNEKWANAITDIQIGDQNSNFNIKTIMKNDLEIKSDEIKIKSSNLKLGENILKIHAKGYRTVTIKQNIVKGKVTPKLQDKYYINDYVSIANLSEQYLNSIRNITLNGKILADKQWSVDKSKEELILHKDLFKEAGHYKVNIDTNKDFDVIFINVEVKNPNDTTTPDIVDTKPAEKVLPKLIAKDTKKGTDDINIRFKTNKHWEESIYKVQKIDIAPGLYKDLQFIVTSGQILVKQNNDFYKNGEYRLRVFAKDYDPVDVIVNLYNSHPELTLESVPTMGKVFTMGMSRNTFDYDWISNIKEVYIDGKLLEPDKEYLKAIERLEIKPGAVTKAGKHTITIKSKGFNDAVKEVVYFNEDGTRPDVGVISKEEELLKSAPENVTINIKEVQAGGALVINNAYYGDYKVKSITLNGKELEYQKDFTSSILGNIMISENVLNKVGENTIVLHVDGYENKEFKIEVKDSDKKTKVNVEDDNSKEEIRNDSKTEEPDVTKPGKPEIENLKPVSDSVRLLDNKNEFNIGEQVSITLGFDFGYNVSSVYLNGSKLNKDNCSITPLGISIKNNVLNKVGQNTIVLKADGYEDKEFNIEVKDVNSKAEIENSSKTGEKPDVDTIPIEEVSLKSVPEDVTLNIKEVQVGEALLINNAYYGDYKVKSITLNGKELEYQKDFTSSILGNIMISENVLNKVGENTIVLHVDGYENKEFNIKVKDKSNN
ncbi:DUF1533 domain-containing protein [Clostridium tetani]|uniref:DUF1533 domain-containing protein n=1 Tax=Clostridium tetani TaxID=1513 RepID=UPI00100AA704|nr:DUF1533 domain-containing protein [Clostridium tetani]RXM58337.1 hypothetical protein DP133_05740 [Clostridium tetani]